MFTVSIRRAKAERESRRKALRAREQKGVWDLVVMPDSCLITLQLLSPEEKAVLAAEEEQAAREKNDDCLIM